MAGSGHWEYSFVATLALLAVSATAARAASVSAGAGYDYQTGPNGSTWSAPMVFATTVAGSGDATLSLSRFDSSDVGWGWNGLANVGLSFGPRVGGRALAMRSVGDGEYRAWQAQAGPTFQLGQNRSLFVYGSHFEDDLSARLNQVGAEASVPLGAQFSGLAGAAIGEQQGGNTNVQGTAGVTWSRWKGLLLIGQTTFGKHIIASSTAGVAGGGSVGPLGSRGRGHSAQPQLDSANALEATALVGIRVIVP